MSGYFVPSSRPMLKARSPTLSSRRATRTTSSALLARPRSHGCRSSAGARALAISVRAFRWPAERSWTSCSWTGSSGSRTVRWGLSPASAWTRWTRRRGRALSDEPRTSDAKSGRTAEKWSSGNRQPDHRAADFSTAPIAASWSILRYPIAAGCLARRCRAWRPGGVRQRHRANQGLTSRPLSETTATSDRQTRLHVCRQGRRRGRRPCEVVN